MLWHQYLQNTMKKRITFIFVLIATLASVSNIACRKKGDTSATITVVDLNGVAVGGATVELHTRDIPAPGAPGIVEQTATTDASGQATFIFELEAVLTIEATQGGRFGTGSVRLEKHENVSQQVIVR